MKGQSKQRRLSAVPPQEPGERLPLRPFDIEVVALVEIYAAANAYVSLIRATGREPVCDLDTLSETLDELRNHLGAVRSEILTALEAAS